MEGQQFEHMGHHQNLSVHHSCTKFAIVSENVKFSWLRCVGLTKQVAEVTQLSQEDLCARMCAGKGSSGSDRVCGISRFYVSKNHVIYYAAVGSQDGPWGKHHHVSLDVCKYTSRSLMTSWLKAIGSFLSEAFVPVFD